MFSRMDVIGDPNYLFPKHEIRVYTPYPLGESALMMVCFRD